MTSVGYFGPLGLDIRLEDERVTIDFTGKSELERSIRAFQKAGLQGPFHWIMGKDIRDWAIEQAGSRIRHRPSTTSRCMSSATSLG